VRYESIPLWRERALLHTLRAGSDADAKNIGSDATTML